MKKIIIIFLIMFSQSVLSGSLQEHVKFKYIGEVTKHFREYYNGTSIELSNNEFNNGIRKPIEIISKNPAINIIKKRKEILFLSIRNNCFKIFNIS